MHKVTDAVAVVDDGRLDLDARRKLVAAAKKITEMRLDSVTTDFGIQKQNLYSLLTGRKVTIGVANQFLVMRNYGFDESGQLLAVLHAWVVNEWSDFELVKDCLEHEKGIKQAVCQPVVCMLRELEFVGVYLRFKAAGSSKERRLLITANDNGFEELGFKAALEKALGVSIEVEKSIAISSQCARNVFRWKYGRSTRRKTAVAVPPKKALYSYDFDFAQTECVKESAETILELMLPRFERLSVENAKLRAMKQSSWDTNLISRAKTTLGVIEE